MEKYKLFLQMFTEGNGDGSGIGSGSNNAEILEAIGKGYNAKYSGEIQGAFLC